MVSEIGTLRRRFSIVALVVVASFMAVVIRGLPDGLALEWQGGRPVFVMTDSIAGADSIRAVRAATVASIVRSDTYLPTMLADRDSMLWRWGNRLADPIDIYIAKGGGTLYRLEMEQSARRAFARWERVGLPVRFRFLSQPRGAAVTVLWSDTIIHPQQRPNVGGYANMESDPDGYFTGGKIWIGMSHARSGIPWSLEQIYQTALHEIGHMLGLGHSTDSTDIMWIRGAAPDLSPRDIRSARLLYTLPPGAVGQDLRRYY